MYSSMRAARISNEPQIMHAIASVHVYPFLILNVGKKPKAKVLVSMALEFVHQYLRSHIQHVRARSSCTREGGNLFHFGKDRLCRRTKCCQLFRCVSSYYYPKCVSHCFPWWLLDLFSLSCMHAYGRTMDVKCVTARIIIVITHVTLWSQTQLLMSASTNYIYL